MIPLLLVAALLIAVVSAFFSVSGLGKLFAGAFIPVVIMAASLEMGKLITASFLTRYWTKLTKILKIYYMAAVIILVTITSAGIYGFLTSAYQITSDEFSILEQEISVLDLKKQRFQDQLDLYMKDRGDLNNRVNELTKGLSNNVIEYRDTVTNQIIRSTSSATRNALQNQLNDTKTLRTQTILKIEELTDSITSIDVQILELKSSSNITKEIGPLRYISELTGWSMNKVVNLLTLMIIFVFDPLAISLVVGYNYIKYRISDQEIEVKLPKEKQKIFNFGIKKYQVYGEDSSKNNIPLEELNENSYPIDKSDEIPYYMRSDYDWVNDTRWHSDPDAKKFNRHRARPV